VIKDHKSKKLSKEDDLSRYNVPAVDRAARIMLLLGSEAREMTLAEVAAATGWHKSSVHKILVTLQHHGFLDRNETTKRYSLGFALVRCGQSVLNNLHINHSAKTLLKELADYSGETANLAVLRGTKMVIVDVIESPVQLRVSPPIGTMDPLTVKSNGKAVLAWLPESEVNKIIQTEGLLSNTKNSILKPKLCQNELTAVREQGFATDFEEFQQGISAVSAPVFNSEGQVVATLSIVGPAFRMTKDKMQLYGKKCAEAAAQLSPMIR
jgi:IclR family transcriptional regulator, KDG regulon repressor